MKPGDRIVIEKVENGWLVRPDLHSNDVLIWESVRVFNLLEYDDLGVMSADKTLFGFLKEHFRLEA